MQKQAYPYCPHGAYVGGCGADYMCGACEFGDEPPTVNECKAAMVRMAIKAVEMTQFLISEFGEDNPNLNRQFAGEVAWKDVRPRLEGELREIEHIRQWATDDDDRGWLHRQYEHNVAEWDKQNGEDQFWSLPQHVLDGP